MQVEVTEFVRAHRARVWAIVTDFDRAADRLSGVTSIEILERPADGLVGLVWRETRQMYGRSATETMRIEAARDGWWYEAVAENHGALYRSRVSVNDAEAGTDLSMSFAATPVSLAAKLFTPLAFLFTGSLRRTMTRDLVDVRIAAESDRPLSGGA